MSKSFVNNDYLGPNGLNTSGVGGIVYMMNEMKGDLDDLHSEVSSSVYDSQINSGSYISQIKTFADRDATPSVEGGSVFVTANGRATNIKAFDNAIIDERFIEPVRTGAWWLDSADNKK